MNIRDFEYLIAVDKLKNFSRASEQCFVSQPALSQQINKLEDQLGFEIFERDKKGTITTQKGEDVIRHAKSIIHSYAQIKQINNDKISVRIGLIPTICPYLLPFIVNKLNRFLPNVKFFFLELKTDDLMKKLREGEIDIGVIAHFPDLIDAKLNYFKSYNEEFFLTLPKKSKLTREDFPKIIKKKKLILLEEGNCMSENVKDICSIYKKDSWENSFSDFYATNIETVKNMIKINNGAALLPKLACLNSVGLKTISLKPEKFREVGIVTRQSYTHQKLAKKINNIIFRRLAPLGKF